jgi:2-iminobutanoate/2-iminopropanoate deaminase
MEARYFFIPGSPPPKGPYSPAVAWGGLVFVSGQLPVLPEGEAGPVPDGIEEQARIVLRNLASLLEEAGSSLDHVLKVTVFLADLADLPAFNHVYGEFFRPPMPARSTVQAGIPAGLRLELDAVAGSG